MTNALREFMARHERVALMFSAGKDSAACLKLLRPYIARVTVIWCNPGRPYPEVVEYMAKVKASVPRFVEARGAQPEYIRQHGYPADMVPWEATPTGRQCVHRNTATFRLVFPYECRWANMWQPALRALDASGCTGVVRGEKLVDRPLALPLEQYFAAREYFRPLLELSDAEVIDFLGEDLPPGYAEGLTGSLDCMNCTAFLARNPTRLQYLRRHHPEVYREVGPVLLYMLGATSDHHQRLKDTMQ